MAEKGNFGTVVNSLLDGLSGYATAKTVVGEPIKVEDTILLPLVDVSIGVGAGAALNSEKKRDREAGGMGAKLSPTAILMIKDGAVRILNIKDQTTAMKALDIVPEVVNRFAGKTCIKNKDVANEANNLKKEKKVKE
ncbi:MAG: sporulation protein [Lachnospiraceae bacterium]|nr:sporulation protein [Lachnospiraceae bacterium]MBR6271240.1 sporulation protein [Lachnospiraceae bacterium]